MVDTNWHRAFHPSNFLEYVSLDQFLDKHRVDQDSIVSQIAPCILCRSSTGPGLLLNNGSFLCSTCFDQISLISYPEKYERIRREYLKTRDAWRRAREAYIEAANWRTEQALIDWANQKRLFAEQSPYSEFTTIFWTVIIFCLFVMFAYPMVGLIGIIAASVIAGACKRANSKRMLKWEALHPIPDTSKLEFSKPVPGWDQQNAEPQQPVLRHFHDPLAELSQYDHTILYVFNHWPGYPPFWDHLKERVHKRDGNRCQVTGCPSRVEIHVHHMQPTSKGGEHSPDNLVCLCAFHHGLEPEVGHERVWGDIKNRYFTLVRAHKRRNRSGLGHHFVRAHVRRLELVTPEELYSIAAFYGFLCPSCDSTPLLFIVREGACIIDAQCSDCGASWTAKRALTEETGPRLAEVFTVSRNEGRWRANWKMFAARNHAVFKAEQFRKHRNGTIRSNKDNDNRT